MRVLLFFLAALVALPSAAVSGCRLIGGAAFTPIPQLAAFAPWATIGWLLILLLLLAGRWWWFAAVITVLLAVQVAWVVPSWGARAAAVERPGARPVRVMAINDHIGQADIGAIDRLVQAQDVDVLSVEEVQPVFFDGLAPRLVKQFPYVVSDGAPGPAHGTVIWSRWPIRSLGFLPSYGPDMSRVLLQVPGAVPVTLTGVHTTSPGRGRVPNWKRDLATLVGASKRTTGPQVMLGDFNASRDHAPFRTLLGTGLVDAADAVRMTPWAGVTWPANRQHLPAAVRLDHVLVTPESVAVRAVQVRKVPGTDHRAVLADLEFKAAG